MASPFDPVPDTSALYQQWLDWSSKPENKAGMINFGLQMLQPLPMGQTFTGQLGQAVGAGFEARDRQIADQNERQMKAAEIQARLAQAETDSALGWAKYAEAVRNNQAMEGLAEGRLEEDIRQANMAREVSPKEVHDDARAAGAKEAAAIRTGYEFGIKPLPEGVEPGTPEAEAFITSEADQGYTQAYNRALREASLVAGPTKQEARTGPGRTEKTMADLPLVEGVPKPETAEDWDALTPFIPPDLKELPITRTGPGATTRLTTAESPPSQAFSGSVLPPEARPAVSAKPAVTAPVSGKAVSTLPPGPTEQQIEAARIAAATPKTAFQEGPTPEQIAVAKRAFANPRDRMRFLTKQGIPVPDPSVLQDTPGGGTVTPASEVTGTQPVKAKSEERVLKRGTATAQQVKDKYREKYNILRRQLASTDPDVRAEAARRLEVLRSMVIDPKNF